MKGFLQEYGIIMVVVAVVLGMLAFGKTGYAKSIQEAILGSADHIVETGENIVPKPLKAGTVIGIKTHKYSTIPSKYIVLEEKDMDKYLVLQYDDPWTTQITKDFSGIYEGSTMDNSLENDVYNQFSDSLKLAIQITNIKQSSYSNQHPTSKHETGPNGETYNTISRHVFAPSVDEIGNLVDLNNPDKVDKLLDDLGTYHFWTRDSYYNKRESYRFMSVIKENGGPLYPTYPNGGNSDRLWAFVIDLSKINYTEVGHVDYK